MKKITTLFKKDPNDFGRVLNEVDPVNEWVIKGEGVPMRKFDGTACAFFGGIYYKRYDVKKGRQVPPDAIPCQDPDEITGHWPHWIPVDANKPEDKWHIAALRGKNYNDGTYELIGEKIQGNAENIIGHRLIKHDEWPLSLPDRTFEGLKAYLSDTRNNIEGIVFHHPDGRMCKIRKSDFGIKRNNQV